MWRLKGIRKNEAFEQWSMDIDYLKNLLQDILRSGGTGFIYRDQKLNISREIKR